MRNLFSSSINEKYTHIALLIARVLVGCFMLTHGTGKLQRLFGDEPIQFGDPIGIGVVPSLVLTVFAEVVCSVLIIIGLGTRLATIPLIITMLVAAFIANGSEGFAGQELAHMYTLVYIILLFCGSGKYSADRYIVK